MMAKLLWLAAAGAMGTVSRFALLTTVQRVWPHNWPVGILTVNTLGCFLAAVIVSGMKSRGALPPTVHLVVFTGFMGAFTTYSAFVMETGEILQESGWYWAIVYIVTHVLLGVTAFGLGWWAFR